MIESLETTPAVSELLALLHKYNVIVHLEGEQLRISAPAGVLTPELKQLLTIHKSALQNLLRGDADAPVIPVQPRPGPFPLSFAQQRLWFLDQLEPGEPTYNLSNVFRLRGTLDVCASEHVLTTLVARHEALRTVIRSQDGVPYQLVQPPVALTLPITDLTHLPVAARMEAALDIARRELRRPFDLANDLMVRVRLLRLAADDHLLVASTHHIASDGWSLNIFWREFARLYAGFVNREMVTLPDLAIQYADFSVWQRQWLRGEQLDCQLVYWQRTLSGLTPLVLPTDRPRPAVLGQQGYNIAFRLEQELTRRLRQLAQQEGMTLFMVLLAAFQTLLHRYSGQDDVAVGTAIANRNRTAIEGLVGFFVNTLVIRTDLTEHPGFRTLLQRVRQTALDAFDHQDLPFEKIVEELHPERQRNRHPLFQVMIFQVLAGEEAQTIALPGVQMEPVRVELNTTKFDLSLALREDDIQVHARLSYNTDLFDEATIARLAKHFQTLLAGIVHDPDCPVDRLPLLTQAERQQFLVTWNNTAVDYPRHDTLQQLFERQVAHRPTATALFWGENGITYSELNQRANRMALLLRGQGVVPGAAVGLCLRRSPEMIVALLSILKAGCAYVPLDATYPPGRLAFMAADAGVALILTDSTLVHLLQDTGVQCLLVDAQTEEEGVWANPSCIAAAEDSAYIMYTSGSTGQPKGVAVSHRAVARLVCNVDYVQLGADEVLLQLAPLAFDASTFEIWGALLHGATLVLASDGLPDYAALEALIVRRHVSVLWLTAGLFNSIIEQRPQMLRSISQVLTGGQVLSVHHIRLAQAELPDTQLINGYGPTENTTFTCCYPIPRPLPEQIASIPIGRPISNTQVYILDAHRQPTPIGVVGELCTGGDGLAQGYLGQPELTAARFVDHPFQPGERIYRTGDLARWRADGVIEFLGRNDRQVKIRGHRIEPGEIEYVLCQQPAVRAAAVIAQEEGDEQRLAAYLVADPEQRPTIEALRNGIAGNLPDYMVPTAYAYVDAIPLTTNGKLDVQALLAQPTQSAASLHTKVPPQDDLERQLVHIWQHVLGVRPIGVDDDFFDLGGHSLLAVKLLEQIERSTGRRLPLTVLFETPTVAALAQALRDRAWQPNWSSLVPIQVRGSRTPLFLVPPGGSSALRFRPLSSHLGVDQPVYAFHPIGLDDDQPPHTSVEMMAEYYVRELRQFLPDGPYLIGGMCFGAHVAAEMACQLNAAGMPVLALVVLDAGPPSNGPYWQAPPPIKRNRAHFTRRLQGIQHPKQLIQETTTFMSVRFQRLAAFLHARISKRERQRQIIHQKHLLAQKAYRARPFQAPLILIQSEQYANRGEYLDRWKSLACSTDVSAVEGTSHRELLLQEPFIGQLASRLSASLDRLSGSV